MESSVHPPDPNFICCQEQLNSKTKLAVCSWYLNNDIKSDKKVKISRYHHVPTFGHGTIRRFCNNAASMKKLAARDFEDLLQVCYFENHIKL